MALINGAANGQGWLYFVSQSPKCRRTIYSGPVVARDTSRRHLSFYLICVTRKSCPTGCPCFFLQRASTHWHVQQMMSSWHRCHKLIVTRQSSVCWQSTQWLGPLLPPRETTHLLPNIVVVFCTSYCVSICISFKIDEWKMVYLLSNTSCVVYVVR